MRCGKRLQCSDLAWCNDNTKQCHQARHVQPDADFMHQQFGLHTDLGDRGCRQPLATEASDDTYEFSGALLLLATHCCVQHDSRP